MTDALLSTSVPANSVSVPPAPTLLVPRVGYQMSWLQDDLVDRLIAKNAARPRPGMDKPDLKILSIPVPGAKGQSKPATLPAGSLSAPATSTTPHPDRDAPTV